MSSVAENTPASDPDANNFQSPLTFNALGALMKKHQAARQNEDIFYSLDPPEDESPLINQPPPSLLARTLPGVAPGTIWLGLGAIALVWMLKRA